MDEMMFVRISFRRVLRLVAFLVVSAAYLTFAVLVMLLMLKLGGW